MQTDDSLRSCVGGDVKEVGELESLYSFISLYQCINEYNELHNLVKQIDVLRQKIMVRNSQKKIKEKNDDRQEQTLDNISYTKGNKNEKNCKNGVHLYWKQVPAHFINKTPRLKQKRHEDIQSSSSAPILLKSKRDQMSVSFQYELTIARLLGNLNVKNIYMSSLICIQKHRLINELLELFHVKLDEAFPTLKGFSVFSLNEYLSRINTIKPADLWIIGTSLGFLAHFTQLFAKYFDLPLSGKFVLHSSMSYIVRNDPTAHLHCSELKNEFSCKNWNECVMGEETKKIDHNENIANGVLKQSDFCISSPILYKERNVHEDSKNFFLENCPTNMTLYSRSSSLRPMLSVTSNTDATKLYLVDENKTSLEGLSTTISNNTVGDSLETIGLVQWPTTDLILASLSESTTTKLKSTLSFFSLKKKNTILSPSLPSSLFNWTCLPLFLRTTQESDKLLFAQGLLTFQSTIRQLCSFYESKNGCNLLNPLQKNFIKSYPIKTSTNFLKIISTDYTKETSSLFDPFRRIIAYELLYKSVKQ